MNSGGMASIPRPAAQRQPFRLYVTSLLILTIALGLAVVLPEGHPVLWGTPFMLIAGVLLGALWFRASRRARAQQLVAARLARLPGDFVILHDLLIPAPWGNNQIDHLILSRFGVVVVANGIKSRWMLEQVEAVRTLLFSQGFKAPQIPVRSLVVVPPGMSDPHAIESDAPVIRVEQIRLQHVAPSTEAVLSQEQIERISRELTEVQHIA